MKRNADLAWQATNDPTVASMRHEAIDKLTATAIALGALNRDNSKAADEIEREERAMEMMEDSWFLFRKYVRTKLKVYEALLTAKTGEHNDDYRE